MLQNRTQHPFYERHCGGKGDKARNWSLGRKLYVEEDVEPKMALSRHGEEEH